MSSTIQVLVAGKPQRLQTSGLNAGTPAKVRSTTAGQELYKSNLQVKTATNYYRQVLAGDDGKSIDLSATNLTGYANTSATVANALDMIVMINGVCITPIAHDGTPAAGQYLVTSDTFELNQAAFYGAGTILEIYTGQTVSSAVALGILLVETDLTEFVVADEASTIEPVGV